MAHPPITLESAVATLTAGRCADLVEVLAQNATRVSDAQLGEVVSALIAARAGVEAALYALTREAESRGVIAGSTSATPAQWVRARAAEADVPFIESTTLQQAVAGTRTPGMTPLVEATLAARIPVASCATVTRIWRRIQPLIEPADHDEALELLIARAADGASVRTLAAYGEELLAAFALDGVYDELAARRAESTAMSAFRYDTRSGMYSSTVRLDAGGKSLVDAVIGALSAPAPGPDAAPDWRSPDKRRADALVEACGLVSTHTHELCRLDLPSLASAAATSAARPTAVTRLDAESGVDEAPTRDGAGSGPGSVQHAGAGAGPLGGTARHGRAASAHPHGHGEAELPTSVPGHSDDEEVLQQARISRARAQEREAARVATAPARGANAQVRVTIPLDWLLDHLVGTADQQRRRGPVRLWTGPPDPADRSAPPGAGRDDGAAARPGEQHAGRTDGSECHDGRPGTPHHRSVLTAPGKAGRVVRPGRHVVLDEHGTVLPTADVRRLACDAGIIPVVLGGATQPLEVGRTRRLATPAQRAALVVRDGGCTFTGCDRPPSWCQAHHIHHWEHGGPTDLANLTLLCQRHHGIVHRDHLTATLVPGPDGPRMQWTTPSFTRAA